MCELPWGSNFDSTLPPQFQLEFASPLRMLAQRHLRLQVNLPQTDSPENGFLAIAAPIARRF
jgi:hypothetical protein